MRIDSYLYQNLIYQSRTKASEAILRGDVYVNGKPVKKPSFEVMENDKIEIVVDYHKNDDKK